MALTVMYVEGDGRLREPREINWPTLVRNTPAALQRADICARCPNVRPLCCDRGATCRQMGDGTNEHRLFNAIIEGNRCPEGRH